MEESKPVKNFHEERADALHKAHAHQKLKLLFISRNELFNRRVNPTDSEDHDSLEQSINKEVKNVPHATQHDKASSAQDALFSSSVSITWSTAPEVLFLLVCFFDIVFSTFLVVAGITGIAFRSSVDAVVNEPPELPAGSLFDFMQKEISDRTSHYKMTGIRNDIYGIVQLACGLAHVMNSIFGCRVIIRGMKRALLAHAAISFILLLSQVFSAYTMFTEAKCESAVFRIMYTSHFINKYTIGADSKLKIDAIQRSLSCCGVIDGWTEYKNYPLPDEFKGTTSKRLDLAGDLVIFPPSCCHSWWIRNLQCASDIETWPSVTKEDITFIDRRLNHKGCVTEVETLCFRMVLVMGKGTLVASAGHATLLLITIFCVIWQIKVINAIISDGIRHEQQAEDLCMGIFDGLSDTSLEFDDSDEEEDENNRIARKPIIDYKLLINPPGTTNHPKTVVQFLNEVNYFPKTLKNNGNVLYDYDNNFISSRAEQTEKSTHAIMTENKETSKLPTNEKSPSKNNNQYLVEQKIPKTLRGLTTMRTDIEIYFESNNYYNSEPESREYHQH